MRYKSIVGDDDNNRKWYQPTVNARLKKYFAGVDWENVSSNLEKLPYYAYMLDKNTQKCGTKPEWFVLPVGNFDAYYGNTYFSRKWLCKIPNTIFEQSIQKYGVCRVKLK